MTLFQACPAPYIWGMKTFSAVALACVLSAAPLAAEENDSRSLMEEGLDLFMDGLRQEMAPAVGNLRELAEQFGPSMRSFLQEMGPAFAEMLEEVQDWTRYHPPEILPNGDIIIRKRQPDDLSPDPKTDPQDETPPGMTDI